MGVKLVSSSGGSVEINPPTTASNFTATMPAGTGNVVVNGINGSIVSGTAVASTSGTAIDFTGIPSWVKRITVMFNGVSTNGASQLQIQIGAGSVTTSGYLSYAVQLTNAGAIAGNAVTSGFHIFNQNASAVRNGSMVLHLVSSNNWVSNHAMGDSAGATALTGGGSLSLGGTFDRVRVTTVNGTDTFDAGSINILYE
jgi:hypothetical protein